MEFSEFKNFIRDNIKIIENENREFENVEIEQNKCCSYSEEKKNEYLNNKFNGENGVYDKLQNYFNTLKINSERQRDKYIADYSMKLKSSFGEYNEEEKDNVYLIRNKLNDLINHLYSGIIDYQSYVEKSLEESRKTFRNKIKRKKKKLSP